VLGKHCGRSLVNYHCQCRAINVAQRRAQKRPRSFVIIRAKPSV
jgi:hypothetical protein